ncbi:MarR family winged helix-turn-helix transcriptional regulator [Jeotgalibacillus soli]|uniref:HTH marR-type domain-containing protein n=1 Tax=Jeotgalibacillus soli TaxID=889306 RepID=A0A0C2VSU3_9BACL|nr:MarR family transcriptional regulator [Jeotgalibacillus soli]KIL51992.1 hypothetical protein KP78_03620 [Jeotgalibacillus soli]
MSSIDSSFMSLHAALRDFSVSIQELSDPFLMEEDLTPVQYTALEFIILRESVSARALSDFLKVKPAAVSSLITRLEKKNFISRMEGKADRRMINLSATSEGQEVYDRIFHRFSTMLDQIYTKLSCDDHMHFERIIRKLNEETKSELTEKQAKA